MSAFVNPVKETALLIPGPAGSLEAVFTPASASGPTGQCHVAVICHPHPSHGGTMDNKVVTTVMRSYRDAGVAVIRFNFRGVGKSAGAFDQGMGELEDLLAVVAWVSQAFPEADLMLAGFSFGSAIAAQASYRCAQIRHLLLIAPPVERYAFDLNGRFDCPLCVIQGDKDERVVVAGVYSWVESLRTPVELVRYADATHFFHGFLTNLKDDVMRVVAARLGQDI